MNSHALQKKPQKTRVLGKEPVSETRTKMQVKNSHFANATNEFLKKRTSN
jgi:hypothetical protein